MVTVSVDGPRCAVDVLDSDSECDAGIFPRPDVIPFAFDNACLTNWGQGSCWINGALHFLFSSERIRRDLWADGAAILHACAYGLGENRTLVERALVSDSLKKIRRLEQ